MKKLGILTAALLMLLSMTACGTSQKLLTPDSFRSIFTAKEYTVEEYKNGTRMVGCVSQQRASREDGVCVDFYVLRDEKAAKQPYQLLVSQLKKHNKDTSAQVTAETSLIHTDSFYLKTPISSMKAVRRDNTVLFVAAPAEYDQTVKSICSEMGY